MCRPPPPRVRLPADQRRARHVRQRGDLAITQRHIQMLPPARALAGQQRGHDRITAVQPCSHVRDRDADLDGRPVARARQVHEPELGLDHDVVPRTLPVGARLAVAGDRGVDQAGVERGEGGVVELVLGQRAGHEVLDQDVGAAGEGVEKGDAGLGLEGDGEGLFVSVDLMCLSKQGRCGLLRVATG